MAEAERDLLIFDGDCKFCRAQAQRLGRWAGEGLEDSDPEQHDGEHRRQPRAAPGDLPLGKW